MNDMLADAVLCVVLRGRWGEGSVDASQAPCRQCPACRWAVLNNVAVLRRHAQAHEELAQSMAAQATVGECISVIEKNLAQSDDV